MAGNLWKFALAALALIGGFIGIRNSGKSAAIAKVRLEDLKVAEDTLTDTLEKVERDISIENANEHLRNTNRNELFAKLHKQQQQNRDNT